MTVPPPSPSPEPLLSHIAELRRRLLIGVLALLIGTGACYLFAAEIYGFLVRPLAEAMGPGDTNRLIYTDLTEAFFTYLKVALFAGTFLAFPVIVGQIWAFVAPGLYAHERRSALPFLVASPILFFAGGALVYYVVLPLAWKFFLSFQSAGPATVLPIMLEARVGEYLSLVMVLIFAFGLAFQLPVVLALLARSGIITLEWLKKKRRYAIVLIFVIAGFITPPDVLSQISLALPMIALYELSILLIRFQPPSAPRPDEHAP